MEAELAALASSGATTLVGLMASDAWAQVSRRLAAFFGRSGDDGAEEELRLSQEELLAASADDDEGAVADVEAVWRARMRQLLRADPSAAAELRALLDELAPAAAAPEVAVTNSVTGGVQHGPVIQGQNFSNLTFHSGPAGRDAAGDPA